MEEMNEIQSSLINVEWNHLFDLFWKKHIDTTSLIYRRNIETPH